MDVSVIIAASRPEVDRCIASIASQEVPCEIIVVGEEGMARPPGDITWIVANTTNPATKRNIGASAAAGRYLAFIDDDAWAPADWLKKIIAAFDADPTLAGVGGPNILPEEANDAERLTDAVLASGLGSGTQSYTVAGEEHEAAVGEIHLVNFAVRRDFFIKMGGFNEALGYGAEDSEFIYVAKRLQQSQFSYKPHIFVWHRRREWGGQLLLQRFRLRMQNGRLLWIRPGMYVGHRMFAAGLIAAWLGVPFILMAPTVCMLMGLVYLGALGLTSFKIKYENKLRWMFATAALHAVSVAGLLAGILRVPSRREYERLLRRSA